MPKGTLLRSGQKLHASYTGSMCRVGECIGAGGQGEAYLAEMDGTGCVLKWYFREYLAVDLKLWKRLDRLILERAPNADYAWPFDLVSEPGQMSYGGYLMPLVQKPPFSELNDLRLGKIDASFRTLATIGMNLANDLLQLHAKGLCYVDLNLANALCDFSTGDIRILDNDNIIPNGDPPVMAGEISCMAPEVVREEIYPNKQTDLFSFAVLLFCLFIIEHPLLGKRQFEIPGNFEGRRRLHGTEPLFMFDPVDRSNEPAMPDHQWAVYYWNLYPKFLRDLFMHAFIIGLRDPYARITGSEWRLAMARLRDSIFPCALCGAENFYDLDVVSAREPRAPCWQCQKIPPLPPRLRIAGNTKHVIMLVPGTKLFAYHLNWQNYDRYRPPFAEVGAEPGLRNLSTGKWTARTAGSVLQEIGPGGVVPLLPGTTVNFPEAEGQIAV